MTRALQRAALMLVACVFVTTIQAQEPVPTIQGNAPLIALGDFDFAAVHEWWAAELELGKGIADLITDSLINDGTYRVLERRFLRRFSLSEVSRQAQCHPINPLQTSYQEFSPLNI